MENTAIENRITDRMRVEYRSEIEAGVKAGFTYEQSKSMALDFIRKKYEIDGDLSVSENATLGGTMKWFKKSLEKKAEQVSLKTSTGTKICTKCGLKKNYSEFWANKTTKDGFQYWCKDCMQKVEKKSVEAESPTSLFKDVFEEVDTYTFSVSVNNMRVIYENGQMYYSRIDDTPLSDHDIDDALKLRKRAHEKIASLTRGN